MHTEFLIIGQGLCGTWLSYWLHKAKRSFLVIDNNQLGTSSRIAAGIINPVTGRRLVKAWMIDELLPGIKKSYTELGNDLNITAISHRNIIDFFPDPFMKESFLKRVFENCGYLHLSENPLSFHTYFNYEFGYGEIGPAYTAHLETILPAWNAYLKLNNCLIEEDFVLSGLEVSEKEIRYKDIKTEKLIFCDGAAISDNPWFGHLPFAFNKGEILIIEVPGLPVNHVYKKGLFLAPIAETNLFWAGSGYSWNFSDVNPTAEFRNKTEKQLNNWLKVPFKIVDHKASLRPATIERRPFVGMHPVKKNIGILNGMGTKGCSLAPYFAKQLTGHLIHKEEIPAEADIKRFSKILERKQSPPNRINKKS